MSVCACVSVCVYMCTRVARARAHTYTSARAYANAHTHTRHTHTHTHTHTHSHTHTENRQQKNPEATTLTIPPERLETIHSLLANSSPDYLTRFCPVSHPAQRTGRSTVHCCCCCCCWVVDAAAAEVSVASGRSVERFIRQLCSAGGQLSVVTRKQADD